MPGEISDWLRENRRIAGRLGGLSKSARYDVRESTAAATLAFRARFLQGHTDCPHCPAVAIPDGVTPEERARRADALFRAHFVRLAALRQRGRR